MPSTPVKLVEYDFILEAGLFPEKAEPGLFQDFGEYVVLACPGCGRVSAMDLKPRPSPSWTFDRITGTMSPSINCVGCCGWHGWLRNGEFIV